MSIQLTTVEQNAGQKALSKFSQRCRALEISRGIGRISQQLLMLYFSKVDLLTIDSERFYEAQEYGRDLINTFHIPIEL